MSFTSLSALLPKSLDIPLTRELIIILFYYLWSKSMPFIDVLIGLS
jgi:hypothetical protein